MQVRREHEEVYFGIPVEWNRVALLPVIEIAVAAAFERGSCTHIRAGAGMAGVVLARGTSGRLIWARHRPYSDFRDVVRRFQAKTGA